jgi:hypothetical protein
MSGRRPTRATEGTRRSGGSAKPARRSGSSAKRGPVESVAWPTRLRGAVVDPKRMRIHGYAVAGDLALHYSFAEVVLLALTGAPPEPAVGVFFARALVALMPVAVGDAPAHAALLARLTGARAPSVAGVAATVAAQGAGALMCAREQLEAWEASGGPLPPSLRGASPRDRAVRRALREAAADAELAVPALARSVSAEAALTAALVACGLAAPWQLAAAITMASLPCSLAEAFAPGGVDLRSYPMTLPAFAYADPRRDGRR